MGRSTFNSMLQSVRAEDRRLMSRARQHERAFKSFDAAASVAAEIESRSVQPSRKGGGDRWRDALEHLEGDPEGTFEERVSVQRLVKIIDAELTASIAACVSVGELRAMRRQFAMKCHPDRFSTADREVATREMKRVNEAVDAAIERML